MTIPPNLQVQRDSLRNVRGALENLTDRIEMSTGGKMYRTTAKNLRVIEE